MNGVRITRELGRIVESVGGRDQPVTHDQLRKIFELAATVFEVEDLQVRDQAIALEPEDFGARGDLLDLAAAAAAFRTVGRMLSDVRARLDAEVWEAIAADRDDAGAYRWGPSTVAGIETTLRGIVEAIAVQLAGPSTERRLRERLADWRPACGMTRAEYARRAFAADVTLTPVEYAQLVADADDEDRAAELRAELEDRRP